MPMATQSDGVERREARGPNEGFADVEARKEECSARNKEMKSLLLKKSEESDE
jgi:hypothetical protein